MRSLSEIRLPFGDLQTVDVIAHEHAYIYLVGFWVFWICNLGGTHKYCTQDLQKNPLCILVFV